jgi:hypothetical protein
MIEGSGSRRPKNTWIRWIRIRIRIRNTASYPTFHPHFLSRLCSLFIAVLPGKHEEGEKDVDEREEDEDDNEDEDDDSDTDTESEMKVMTTIKMDL